MGDSVVELRDSVSQKELTKQQELKIREDLADLHVDIYDKTGEFCTELINSAIGHYEKVLTLLNSSDSSQNSSVTHQQHQAQRIAALHATLGNMYEKRGDMAQSEEHMILAINENGQSLKERYDRFATYIDTLVQFSDRSKVLNEFKSWKDEFSKEPNVEFLFIEKLKEVKIDFGEEVLEETSRLTELEDFGPGTVINLGCVANPWDTGEDIDQQLENIQIPKKDKPETTGQTDWLKRRNKEGETILQQKVIQLKITGETHEKIEEIRKLIEEENPRHPVNVDDHVGYTPLHEAANLGSFRI